MEMLNFKNIKTLTVLAAVSIASTAFAGPGFRMNSKAPVYHQKVQKKAYIFGYGGVDTGAHYDSTGAFADTTGGGYYGSTAPFDLGAIPINTDLDNGWTAGGGVGVYSGIFGGSRFELEGSYTSNSNGYLSYAGFELPADFDIETSAVFVNYLKEIPLGKFCGYLGGGAGYAETSFDGTLSGVPYSDTDGGFAWQLIAGLEFPVTESLALFTQYRYMVLSELAHTTDFGDFTQVTDEDLSSHAVLFGARVSF